MADYKPEPGKGTIFLNQYKKESKHPDYNGTVNIDGKLYDISLWVNKKKGSDEEYFGVNIKEHDETKGKRRSGGEQAVAEQEAKQAEKPKVAEPAKDLPF